MKKTLLVTAITTIAFTQNSQAEDINKVILHTDSKNVAQELPKRPRIPAYIPSVYLEDTTLSFEASCIGCTITLLQNNNVVFTAIIDEDGIVVLPDYLFGEKVF